MLPGAEPETSDGDSLISNAEYRDFSRRVWDKSVARTFPTRVQFEITYRCNIHCVHCYTDPFNTPVRLRREMSFDEILRLFDELQEAGVLWMLLTGGEALVHPRFREIYSAAKKRGFLITLFSNGTTVTDELADFLAADPPFKLEVSCHGSTDETFERVTQVPGSFRRFREGIRRILDRGLPLRIKTKAMKVNYEELARIKEFVESLGLEFNLSHQIYPRLNGDTSSVQYRLAPEEIVDLEFGDPFGTEGEGETCEEKKEAKDSDSFFAPPSDDRLFRCGCGTNSLTISPYGILRACTFTVWPSFDLKVLPLRTAFSHLAETIRRAHYEGASPCRLCPVHRFCDKNPAMALYEAGSMEAPVKERCDIAYAKAEAAAPRISS